MLKESKESSKVAKTVCLLFVCLFHLRALLVYNYVARDVQSTNRGREVEAGAGPAVSPPLFLVSSFLTPIDSRGLLPRPLRPFYIGKYSTLNSFYTVIIYAKET